MASGAALGAEQIRGDAQNRNTMYLRLDNDAFAGTDRGYTNGIVLGFTSPTVESFQDPRLSPRLRWLNRRLGWLQPRGFEENNVTLTFGQGMFTPEDWRLSEPDPLDRPYAGVLAAGVTYNGRNENSMRTTTLTVGMVGPSAGGGAGCKTSCMTCSGTTSSVAGIINCAMSRCSASFISVRASGTWTRAQRTGCHRSLRRKRRQSDYICKWGRGIEIRPQATGQLRQCARAARRRGHRASPYTALHATVVDPRFRGVGCTLCAPGHYARRQHVERQRQRCTQRLRCRLRRRICDALAWMDDDLCALHSHERVREPEFGHRARQHHVSTRPLKSHTRNTSLTRNASIIDSDRHGRCSWSPSSQHGTTLTTHAAGAVRRLGRGQLLDRLVDFSRTGRPPSWAALDSASWSISCAQW